MDPQQPNLFVDFLSALGVRHTRAYSTRRFASMTFKSLFGVSKLLQEYGVDTAGVSAAACKGAVRRLPVPFIAGTPAGMVIVTAVTDSSVTYLTQDVSQTMPVAEFERVWDGNALLARPRPGAAEPDYTLHHVDEVGAVVKRRLLAVCAALLLVWLFVTGGIWRYWSTVALTALDLAGLWFSFMLVRKSLGIHSAAADRVCGVLQRGGCDEILKLSASKFFGLFGWSEVGFAYFSVSLLALLVFPEWTRYLAACNVCCLPFTVWSIWYQRFRARHWCTLCVCVQAILWLSFFCYLGGGWLHGVFPLRPQFFVLGLTYLTVLLGLNRLMPRLESQPDSAEADNR